MEWRRKEMSELKPLPCPICGAELKVYSPEDWKPTFYDPDSGGDPYNAVCDCGFQFSNGGYDYAVFVNALNRRTQPDNEPLTLDELRGMDGEPVWVVFDDDSAMWALVDDGHVAEELKLTTNWGGQIVLAEHKAHIKEIYRRKPEGSKSDAKV